MHRRQKTLLLGVIVMLFGLVQVASGPHRVGANIRATKVLIVFALDPDPAALVSPDALAQAAATVQRRAQAVADDGVKVWTSDENRIVVEVPGLGEGDITRIADSLVSNALLELIDPQGQFLETGTIVVTTLGGPSDSATPTAETVYTTIVSGNDVRSALKEIDQFGQPAVRFSLTDEASLRVFNYTSEHLNLPLSIVLDKKVLSTPLIKSAIRGEGIIVGLTEGEVDNLVLQFNTGALAVPLKVELMLVLNGLPGDSSNAATPAAIESPIATPNAIATPVASAGCWTPNQVVGTDPLEWSDAPGFVIDPAKQYSAEITTNLGAFTIALLPTDAPITVNNFVCLARAGFYDNTPIHRIVPGFVIQAGDATGTGVGDAGYVFADEPVTREYILGTIAMANAGPDTNGSQFFVTLGDFTGRFPKDCTIFGLVSDGMNVIERIAAVPVEDIGRGEASTPVDPVTILTVTITESRAL